MDNDTRPDGHASTVATLEKRYIQLLEERIAQLETRLNASNIATVPSTGPKQPTSELGQKENHIAPTSESSEASSNSLVHFVVSKFDQTTSKRRDFVTSRAGSGGQVEHHVIFRQYMDSEKREGLRFEEIEIYFDGLKELLRKTLKHCSKGQFSVKVVNFRSPFNNFVWQWDELKQACEPKDADTHETILARRCLKEVLDLIEGSETLGAYFRSYKSDLAGGNIAFENLWTIFPPGALVLAKSFLGEFQMFEVKSCLLLLHLGDKEGYQLVVAGLDWDGTKFIQTGYCLTIPQYDGSTSIINLPCFPVSFYHSKSDLGGMGLKDDLLARGHKFAELCTSRALHHKYQGHVLFHHDGEDAPDDTNYKLKRAPTKSGQLRLSEIIVDNASFLRSGRCPANGSLPLGSYPLANPSQGACPCYHCLSSPRQKWLNKVNMFDSIQAQYEAFKRSDELLLLCPPRVLGYSLKLSRWAQFSVSNVQPFVRPEMGELDNIFNSKLRMGSEYKTLIKALVETHRGGVNISNKGDVIEGKGKGLVILLHGPPGVGKTLTAETVALATHKPLMQISTAEIGVEPAEAEKNLTDVFEDAGRWQAVLLMDEADIFLEDRANTKDLKRNALVAVLLRVLEYYEGIIIMTTNRIASLDVAVESRIHLAIRFRDLDQQDQLHIFQTILDEVVGEENVARRGEMDLEIEKMVRRSRINGRQIRNIVTSANLYAKSQNKKLKFSHIETVHEITEEFLEGLKKMTQKKRLRNEGSNDSD